MVVASPVKLTPLGPGSQMCILLYFKRGSRDRSSSSRCTIIVGVGLGDQDAVLVKSTEGITIYHKPVSVLGFWRGTVYPPRVCNARDRCACCGSLDFDPTYASETRAGGGSLIKTYRNPYIESVTVFPEIVTSDTDLSLAIEPMEIP